MKNWSLNAKVSFVLSILGFGAIVISCYGIFSLGKINDNLQEIVNVDVKRDQLTSLITDQQRLLNINILRSVLEKDQKKVLELEKVYQGYKNELYKYVKEYKDSASGEGQKLAEKYSSAAEKWFDVNTKIQEFSRENNDVEIANIRDNVGSPLIAEMRGYIKEMNGLTAKRLEEAKAESEENYKTARLLLIAVSFISIFASALIAYFIMKSVSRAIDNVIANLNDNSSQVTSAAQQIAASSEQLSQAATEQASSLEETSSSIEEMSSMVQKNSENAHKSSDISNTSHSSATRGKTVVQDMIKAIEGINESNHQIAEIVRVISEIGNKTKVINDIVFQTKLLSFNASVEAARAGEHGKGFAVVAEEVGNLAQMSGNAAKEIATMLEGSIQKVNAIVSETKVKVETGTKVAYQCGEVLDEIVGNVSTVNVMVSEISTACQEQSQGVQEITKAINQLDQVTQENAATSEEAASAAEELAAQAESLRGVVRVLTETIKGKNGVESHASDFRPKASSHHQSHDFEHDKKVLTMKPKKVTPKTSHSEYKQVAGLEGSVPSENDPRFEDI